MLSLFSIYLTKTNRISLLKNRSRKKKKKGKEESTPLKVFNKPNGRIDLIVTFDSRSLGS